MKRFSGPGRWPGEHMKLMGQIMDRWAFRFDTPLSLAMSVFLFVESGRDLQDTDMEAIRRLGVACHDGGYKRQ
ncbi:hypothetical protein VTJ04DRAFT_8359 [Mycothermus thermophilus]|uniref:uncharacterized protein n=1 Tax=Humicola insolens TaxID=85995 RepID=UPI003742B139